MSSLPLTRTEYWNLSTNTVRGGATAHGESLTDMEDYLLPLAQMEASSFYTWGVVDGLTVTAGPNQPGLTVSPGVALDAAGHVISLAVNGSAVVDPTVDPNQVQNIPTVLVGASGLALTTAGVTGDCFLTLTWREVLGDSQLGNAPILIHAPWLRLVPVAGFSGDGEQVILARVSLDANGQVTGLAVAAAPQASSTAGLGRRGPAAVVGAVSLRAPELTSTTALSVGDTVAGELRALDGVTLRLAATDPAGRLELAAGQGPASGVTVTADRLSLQAAADTQGSNAISLDLTSSTVTARTLRLGGAQSQVSLATGPTADILGVTASQLAIRGTDGTDQISLDGPAATVRAGSVVLGGALSLTTGQDNALALSATPGTAKLGVGTTSPRGAVGIRAAGVSEELLSFEDSSGVTRWHLNQNLGGREGLNLAQTGTADGRLFLAVDGKMGVGTTTPAFELDVNGTVCARVFCNPSDARLKQDVTPLGDVLGRLAAVRAVSFRPVGEPAAGQARRQVGVVAQDVRGSFPELVVDMGTSGHQAVNYAALSAVLVAAVQELQASQAELAARFGELERRLTSLPADHQAAGRVRRGAQADAHDGAAGRP